MPDKSDKALTRRDFVRSAASIGVSATLPIAAAGAEQGADPPSGNTRVPRVKLGKTGMMVSRLALGGSWDIDHEVLALAFSLGINYIDTAESYRGGQSERLCGEFLKSIGAVGHSPERRKVWLVSKTHDHRTFEKSLPGCLDRLGQSYVDCFYMHQISDPKLATSPDVKAQAERMKRSGQTRFFGFSVHDSPVVECLNAAADSDFIDVIMFRYDCHYYPREDLMKAIDRCHDKGIGLVAMKTQVGGKTLPDKFDPFKKRGLNQHQAAIKAVASDERIHSVCSEMTTTEMITQNSEAIASKITLAEIEAVQEHARLISHLWCRGCDSICRNRAGLGSEIAVADTLRFLMYHDDYGKREHARTLFAALPAAQRSLTAMENGNWKEAERACPYNVPLEKLIARAKKRLA